MKSDFVNLKTRRENLVKMITLFLIFSVFILLFWILPDLFLASLISILFYHLLYPVIQFLQSKKISQNFSVPIFFVLMGFGFHFLFQRASPFLSDQFQKLKELMPSYIDKTFLILKGLEKDLDWASGFISIEKWQETFNTGLVAASKDLFSKLPELLTSSVSIFILVPFITFFMLKDGHSITKKLFNFVPNSFFETSLNIQQKINLRIGEFIRARFIESLIVGVIVAIGLWILEMPFIFILSVFAALTNLLPYIGPFIGAIPALMIAVTQLENPLNVFLTLTPYVVAQLVDIFIIIPFLFSKIVNLHPLTVLVSFFIGAETFGIVGMIVCIPITSALKVIFTEIYTHMIDFPS